MTVQFSDIWDNFFQYVPTWPYKVKYIYMYVNVFVQYMKLCTKIMTTFNPCPAEPVYTLFCKFPDAVYQDSASKLS